MRTHIGSRCLSALLLSGLAVALGPSLVYGRVDKRVLEAEKKRIAVIEKIQPSVVAVMTVIFTTRTANLFQTIINGNQIFVSYELRDASGDTTLGYVAGTHFFSDNIQITSAATGNVVATLTRNTLSIKWVWEISIAEPSDPAAHPLVLALIAGKKSFSDDPNSTDVCNNYFWGVAWTLVAIVSLIGLILLVGLGYVFWVCKPEGWCECCPTTRYS